MLTDDQIKDLQEKARRDDACTIFLPSDIRVILSELVTARTALAEVRDNCHNAVAVVATVNGAIGLPSLQPTT